MYNKLPLVLLLFCCFISIIFFGECLKSQHNCLIRGTRVRWSRMPNRICVDEIYYKPFCLVREEEN